MVAVDHGQRIDPPSDCGIGSPTGACLGIASVDAEQRCDNLEVILYAVVDFTDQPPLALQRGGHFLLGRFDPGDGAGKGFAQAFDLDRWTDPLRHCEGAGARIIGRNGALHPPQRTNQQPSDDQPADQRRRDPHRQR